MKANKIKSPAELFTGDSRLWQTEERTDRHSDSKCRA